ncbi:OmpA family protein [Actinomyces oris]|uniref:OmpA family protein n=1 Tax=Actinomyces TaxID=1654 RepID=UPI000A5284B0|nr:OmpA family protein [Actinomyces oris]
MLEAEWKGAPLSVEVGPAAVNDKYAVVRLVFTTTSDENVSLSQPFGFVDHSGTMLAIRMLSLDKGLVYRELDEETRHLYDGVEKGKPLEVFPVFHAPPEGVGIVELLLPNVGIAAGVPVLKDTEVDFSVDDVLSKAKLDESEAGPFKIETMSLAADDSADMKQDEKSTTVTVAGDVTFATDSDQLSAQADSVLASVVEQIKKFPSGGDLTITGHTDDVADDAHNQELSERRAKAVSERLKRLTDLSKWKESVSGKGESSPRVSNDSDEHRQANRRVEITLTPSKPAESSASPSASAAPSSTSMPKAAGPAGKGPEGVDVKIDGKTVRMVIDHVVRAGGYLAGTVVVTSSEKVSMPVAPFSLPGNMMDMRDLGVFGVSGITILSGGLRYLEADYTYSDGSRLPLANSFVCDLEPEASQSLPVVWPDVGGSSVTIDMPAGEYIYTKERVVARLTDIPVVSA